METQLPPFQYPSSTQRIDACAQLVGNGESSVCLRSTALRDDIRKRYDYIPADVLDNWKISRDTKQCQGIHEAARRSQVIIRTRHGLRRFDVGHNQGLRHAEGTSLAPFLVSLSVSTLVSVSVCSLVFLRITFRFLFHVSLTYSFGFSLIYTLNLFFSYFIFKCGHVVQFSNICQSSTFLPVATLLSRSLLVLRFIFRFFAGFLCGRGIAILLIFTRRTLLQCYVTLCT